MIIVVM